jgi:uncharacterized delta-60 repeat protein
MTPTPRSLISALLAVAGLALAGPAAASAAAGLAAAPGRVVFSVNGGVVSPNVDSGFAALIAPLPGGGVVMLGSGPNQAHLSLAQLTATGALDPSFGTGGIAQLTLPAALSPIRLLRAADGKLLLVGSAASTTPFAPGLISVVRLSADGRLDPSFGSGGIASTTVEATGYRGAAALAPDGDLVVAGATGRESAAIAHDPYASGLFKWVVARLTTTGTLDPTFGTAGLATLPGGSADMRGIAVSPLADGSILALGLARIGTGSPPVNVSLLTRLTPAGAIDSAFAGGLPVALPAGEIASSVLALPGGQVLVAVSKALLRFTAAGAPDLTFASAGVAAVGAALPYPLALFPGADGSVLAVGPSAGTANGVTGLRFTAGGAIDSSLGGGTAGATYVPAFGGGGSSFLVSVNPRPLPPLTQDHFYIADIAQRADGSLIAAGGVDVEQPLGEGVGNSIFDFAAAALTPAFTPVTSFGGPAQALSLRLGVPGQRAATAHSRHGVRVLVNVSAPGLARAYVRVGGTVIAQSVLPIFGSGARILPVELTHAGAVLLRTRRNVHVSVSVTARDLLAGMVTARASGTLK